ncbi:protein arginine N-methyltransferase 3-like [Tropilaelaps mercedesae]|uniref:type I protein arginine methyltransferase n=1 Tax=Tropilaelaps mercedesae TaxID=418985 RepID=A0A1V9XCZ5_9ACAR|nr:protein arginine N-methyltransferase 3-like [Tropilaelaps mercedesae]
MSSSESSDYEEEEFESTNIPCVFCDEVQADDRVFKGHCVSVHSIDIFEIFGRLGDVFRVIKAINYLRRERPSSEDFARLVSSSSHPWNAEEFLQPVIPNDPLLLLDYEDAFDKHRPHHSKNETDEVNLLKERLQLAYEHIASMQKSARAILDSGDEAPRAQRERNDLAVSELKLNDDRNYIESYSHFAIHQEMLQDVHRNEAYRLGILANEKRIEGRTCLDVGCGTGILSMFLAREGKAASVQAVDFSEIIYCAMDIIRENNYQDVVTFSKGKLEDLVERQKSGLKRVGVIVSEWMGYFLLFESMMDTVITARNKLLEPDGLILPCKASMFLTITDSATLHERNVAYWEDVYGFKMTCMKKLSVGDVLVEVCFDKDVCGTEVGFKKFDMYTVTVEETVSFSSPFNITATRDASVTAIVGYFEVYFDPDEKVKLSTRPGGVGNAATHWKQTIFLLPKPISLKRDDSLRGTISVRRSRKNRRGLELDIALENRPLLKYSV